MTESIDQAKSNQVKADQTRTDLAPTDLAKARLATSFGYQDVRSEDKPKMIEDLFGRVATRYDLMNDLMSGGVHRLWKAAMIDRMAPQPGMRLVDVAGGTGDIAFRVLDRINARRSRRKTATDRPVENSPIVVCDANPAMLGVGRDRGIDRSQLTAIEWVCADAQCLPLPSSSMDAYTIAFGIRNVTHIEQALSEAFRVLKPGGRFFCLEFSAFQWESLKPLYDTFSFNIVPWLGDKVADDREAYQYLVESIRRFPDQETFGRMIEEVGFARMHWSNMTGGVAALHSAWRL